MDYRIQPDPEVSALEKIYRPKVDELTKTVVGYTKVYLEGKCRFSECNMGNMITTAFLSARKQQRLTDASVALMASGDIRSSIKKGNITKFALETALPYHNQLVVVNITGAVLYSALEHAVHRYSETIGRGEFVQMSGMRVIYDPKKESGKRVQSASILCPFSETPEYADVDPMQNYGVIITSFVYEGGDGFAMFKVCTLL